MKLYDCTVLLHGEILNQVRKSMVTAAEIRILRGIHVGNNDAVTDITLVGETNRTDSAERRRLANAYGNDPFSLDGETSVSGTELVNRYFPPGVPLPQELEPEQMEDQKAYVPDEEEVITIFNPSTGKMEKVETASPAVAIMQEDNEDPFEMTREAARAQPKLEPSSPALRGVRRTVAVEA